MLLGEHFKSSDELIPKINMKVIREGNGTPLRMLAWKIPWMEEPGRLQSMGKQLQRDSHKWDFTGLIIKFTSGQESGKTV